MTTVKTAVANKNYLRDYQQRFFKSALTKAATSKIAGYRFGDTKDKNRTKAFIDKLLIHRIKVYQDGEKFVVPTKQPQYRMVQTMFETYENYRDSVYYDASAWSLANFYNMKYSALKSIDPGTEITNVDQLAKVTPIEKAAYAYIMDWQDYNAPAALYALQKKGIVASTAANLLRPKPIAVMQPTSVMVVCSYP